MKAIVSTPEGAALREVPDPMPHEIRVGVHAASLNRADLAALAAKDCKVMGMEWAGEITKVGATVRDLRVGDRVMCTGAGGFAEYAVTDWGRACRIPAPDLEYPEACVLPLALQARGFVRMGGIAKLARVV